MEVDIGLIGAVVALAFALGYYIQNQKRNKKPLLAKQGTMTRMEFYALVFLTSFIVMFLVLYWGIQ